VLSVILSIILSQVNFHFVLIRFFLKFISGSKNKSTHLNYFHRNNVQSWKLIIDVNVFRKQVKYDNKAETVDNMT